MIFDYVTLKVIWWGIIGIVIIGFAVTGGFDLGVGILIPVIGKSDEQRRVLLNAVGPTWEGNQTWFITAGGATFAAWPLVYSTAFSSFYLALILLLFALFMRPVGFDYRSKISDRRWRACWDWALFAGGLIPSFIFGVAFGNLFVGLPFQYDLFMHVSYSGALLDLFSPFGVLCGLLSVSMFVMHGASFLHNKTEAELASRSKKIAALAALISVAQFVIGGFMVSHLAGMKILSMPDANSAFVPADKVVQVLTGAWMENYARWPLLWCLPALTILAAVISAASNLAGHARTGLLFSGCAISGIILTTAASLFPFILPSTAMPNTSLTVWDAASSKGTLTIMLWVSLTLLPVILAYTSWVYRVMRGTVTVEDIRANQHSSY